MGEEPHENEDFGALLEAHLKNVRTELTVGDKVEGRVTAVDRKGVYLDIVARSDGIIDRAELLD